MKSNKRQERRDCVNELDRRMRMNTTGACNYILVG
jgi:hypothetical protein